MKLARLVYGAGPGRTDSGVGDVLQSLFLSPSAPAANGLIWGAGPVFLLPTGSDGLGADQFAMGVTGVALKQSGPWTFGVLANHLWDVGGGGDATDISASHMQPFLNHTSSDAVTVALNTEASYDWIQNEGAADQSDGQQGGQAWPEPCQPWRRAALLGGRTRGRPRRLGRAGHRDLPLSALTPRYRWRGASPWVISRAEFCPVIKLHSQLSATASRERVPIRK